MTDEGPLLTISLVGSNEYHSRYYACQHFVLYLALAVHHGLWMSSFE